MDKAVLADDLAPDRRITFTLAIANTGEKAASRVIVTDILPGAVLSPTFTSTLALTATGLLSYVWDVEALAAGEGGIITLTGWISPGLTLTSAICNRAVIWDPEDLSPANNADAAIVSPLTVYLPLSLRSDVTIVPTPTPTATPPTCTEGLADGGFESDGDWEIPGPGEDIYPADYSTAQAHGGDRSMRIGIVDPADNVGSWSSARQLVTIPAGVNSATLRFWLYAVTEEPPLAPSGHATQQAELLEWEELQMVRILTEDEQFLESLVRQRIHAPQWSAYQFDLTSYAGQTITLYFGVTNDGQDGVTGMYVDDVSLQLCTEGSSP